MKKMQINETVFCCAVFGFVLYWFQWLSTYFITQRGNFIMIVYQSRFSLRKGLTCSDLVSFLFQSVTGVDPPEPFWEKHAYAWESGDDALRFSHVEYYGTDTDFAFRYQLDEESVTSVLECVVSLTEPFELCIRQMRYGLDSDWASLVVPKVVHLLYETGWLSDGSMFCLLSEACLPQADTVFRQQSGPVLYVSCKDSESDYGSYSVDVCRLAWRLRGLCQIVVETSPSVRQVFADAWQKAYGISENFAFESFPGGDLLFSADGVSFEQLDTGDMVSTCVLEAAVSKVASAMAMQNVFADYSFEDVMKDAFHQLYQDAESVTQSYVSQLSEKDAVIAQLKEELSNQKTLVHSLQSRLDVRQDAVPTVSDVGLVCTEQPLYPSELQDVILKALKDSLSRIPDSKDGKSSRKYHVLTNILEHNPLSGEDEHIREFFRKAVKSGTMSDKTIHDAVKYGFTCEKTSKHLHVTYQNDPRYTFVLGSSPSDRRAGENSASCYMNLLFGY